LVTSEGILTDVRLLQWEKALNPIIVTLEGMFTEANTNVKQQTMLESAARIGVFAAEQLYGALKGDEKLTYVHGAKATM
jgi:hypothetical protein